MENDIKQLPNGKWVHPLDSGEFETEEVCRADYQFSKDWAETGQDD